MILHLHLRVASQDVAEVGRHIGLALSRFFSVTALHGQCAGEIRLHVDGMIRSQTSGVGDRQFLPRAEIVLRPGRGPTVELLLLRHRSSLASDVQVGLHAESVSHAVIRCLECNQSHTAGIEGHWLASCGWYLHLGSTNFYSERDFRRRGCSCAGRWHESCSGVYEVDEFTMILRNVRRRLLWQAPTASAGFGVHEAKCAGPYAGAPEPPPPMFERLHFKLVDRRTISLTAPNARLPIVTLQRVAGAVFDARKGECLKD